MKARQSLAAVIWQWKLMWVTGDQNLKELGVSDHQQNQQESNKPALAEGARGVACAPPCAS